MQSNENRNRKSTVLVSEHKREDSVAPASRVDTTSSTSGIMKHLPSTVDVHHHHFKFHFKYAEASHALLKLNQQNNHIAHQFIYLAPLGNRGPNNTNTNDFAGFYQDQDTGEQFLIKQDKAARALEGELAYIKGMIPSHMPELKMCVNFAYTSTWDVKHPHDQKTKAAVMQEESKSKEEKAKDEKARNKQIEAEAQERSSIIGTVKNALLGIKKSKTGLKDRGATAGGEKIIEKIITVQRTLPIYSLRMGGECDVILMSTPKGGHYKESDKAHLYLYKNENGIFYRLRGNKKKHYLDKDIRIHEEFNQSKDPLTPCDSVGVRGAVLAITSGRGHTQTPLLEVNKIYLHKDEQGQIFYTLMTFVGGLEKTVINFLDKENFKVPEPFNLSELAKQKTEILQAISSAGHIPKDYYQPWAEFITGKPRDPKTLRSYEAKNKTKILNSIENMTREAKNQFAMAIVLSEAVGDESQHIGQYLVKGTKECITGVVRIDLGAAGRNIVQRNKENDIAPGTGSRSYVRRPFSQLGNNYISIPLADAEIKAKYQQFWIRSVDADKLVEEKIENIKEKLKHMTKTAQTDKIKAIMSTSKMNIKIPAAEKGEFSSHFIDDVLSQYREALVENMIHMRNENIKKVLELNHLLDGLKVKRANPKGGKYDFIQKSHNKLDFSRLYDEHQFLLLCDVLQKNQGQSPSKVGPILYHLEANLEFNMDKAPDRELYEKRLAMIRDLRSNFQIRQNVLKELKGYLAYLTNQSWFLRSSYRRHKIDRVEKAMDRIKKGERMDAMLNDWKDDKGFSLLENMDRSVVFDNVFDKDNKGKRVAETLRGYLDKVVNQKALGSYGRLLTEDVEEEAFVAPAERGRRTRIFGHNEGG